jgi:hypothetical protein
MNKDDIIKLAKKVGLCIDKELQPELIVFSYLVAAAEREACAKVCEEHQFSSIGLAAAIRTRGNT